MKDEKYLFGLFPYFNSNKKAKIDKNALIVEKRSAKIGGLLFAG